MTAEELITQYPGGRGLRGHTPGKRITRIEDIKIGETYILVSLRFGAHNLVKVTDKDRWPHDPGDIAYWQYTHGEDAGREFAMWKWEIDPSKKHHSSELYEAVKIPLPADEQTEPVAV